MSSKRALTDIYNAVIPVGSIPDILMALETGVTDSVNTSGGRIPFRSAFSVSRGAWFEIIVSLYAWNYRIKAGLDDVLIIKMPSVSSFPFRNVFDKDTKDKLDELEDSLIQYNVRMVTSNPDFLIVKQNGIVPEEYNIPITELSSQSIAILNGAYKALQGKCDWRSVRAGIGLKTSVRPDRRLQLVHEGNILKSIIAHLRTRNWDKFTAFRYYSASSQLWTPKDIDALRTAATHTIINVDSVPESAVDELFTLQDTADIELMIERILSEV